MLIFLFMVTGALISAAVASGKNRSAIGWAAIGFLFPLLGVILAIVLPPNPLASQSVEVDLAGL